MKPILSLLALSLISLGSVKNAFAGAFNTTARAGGGTGQWGQSNTIGVSVPAGTNYSYHMFIYGPASGSTYVSFSGAGASVYDSLSSTGSKTNSGIFPTAGQVNGSVFAEVTNPSSEVAETGITINW